MTEGFIEWMIRLNDWKEKAGIDIRRPRANKQKTNINIEPAFSISFSCLIMENTFEFFG